MAVEAQYLPTTIISIILGHAFIRMSREHMAHKVGVVERHGQKCTICDACDSCQMIRSILLYTETSFC